MMKRFLAAMLIATPAAADMTEEAVRYCEERSDIERCKAEQLRGLNLIAAGIARIDDQEAADARVTAIEAMEHCHDEYAPVMLAVGACMDGFVRPR